MERAVALKKLSKMLGKKFRYRFDADAPLREQQEAARAELGEVHKEKERLVKQMAERRDEILSADVEYQALKAAREAVGDQIDKLNRIAYRHRVEVGTMDSIFFHVKAQGDSWEDVLNQLTKKSRDVVTL